MRVPSPPDPRPDLQPPDRHQPARHQSRPLPPEAVPTPRFPTARRTTVRPGTTRSATARRATTRHTTISDPTIRRCTTQPKATTTHTATMLTSNSSLLQPRRHFDPRATLTGRSALPRGRHTIARSLLEAGGFEPRLHTPSFGMSRYALSHPMPYFHNQAGARLQSRHPLSAKTGPAGSHVSRTTRPVTASTRTGHRRESRSARTQPVRRLCGTGSCQ